jgi:hypothetical protein
MSQFILKALSTTKPANSMFLIGVGMPTVLYGRPGSREKRTRLPVADPAKELAVRAVTPALNRP